MKKLIVLFLVVTLFACAPAWKPLCSHDAVYAGVVADADEVVYGWYDTGKRNEYHVVARKMIDGTQYYLVPANGYIWAKTGIKGFEPIEEMAMPFDEYYKNVYR